MQINVTLYGMFQAHSHHLAQLLIRFQTLQTIEIMSIRFESSFQLPNIIDHKNTFEDIKKVPAASYHHQWLEDDEFLLFCSLIVSHVFYDPLHHHHLLHHQSKHWFSFYV